MNIRTISIDGVSYKISLPHEKTDYIQGKIAQTGEPYEYEMLKNMSARLEPGDLVLDIGANIGNHSLYFAAVIGCKVHAFEPNLELCQGLRESALVNQLENQLIVHQIGLSDTIGFAKFDHIDESNLGGQSLTLVSDQVSSIKLERLDDFDFDVPVKAIKVDVEGMELAVLRGGLRLLMRDKPILYIEAISIKEFEQHFEFLRELGYLYLSTFNATPTHLYVHKDKANISEELAQSLIQMQRSAYAHTELVSTLRSQLGACNQKYKDSQTQYQELKSKLGNLTGYNSELLNRLQQSSLELGRLQYKIENLARFEKAYAQSQEENARFEKAYAQSQEKINILGSKLEYQVNRTNELFERANNLNNKLAEEKDARRASEKAIQILKQSRTWKAGIYVNKASGSILEAIKLPVRLWRLRKTGSVAGLTKTLEVVPTSSAQLSSGVVFDPSVRIKQESEQRIENLNREILIEKQSKNIRIACIMDEFTYESFSPEAKLFQLTPAHWEKELEECQPELLFIESAWRGKEELWGSKVGHLSSELLGIINWCRDRQIPTVFWNKEDPIHFETFLNTANQFDYVFTTDMDCVHRYKDALGHERVYFLPFACQPVIHNPIEKYQRKDAFCFAGAYYVRYPERTRDLQSFVEELPKFKPLEIYDRNFGKNHPDYQFPDAYQPYIVGTLSFDEIDKAYKGYNYAINLNSIKQSQSMFARRVYELLGSNTLTVSNFSRGLRLLFGDLIVTSDSGAEIKNRLELLNEKKVIDRVRLAGLRKVMSEHTYEDRLNYVLEKVTQTERVQNLPQVHVIAQIASISELPLIIESIERQKGVNLSATIVLKSGLTNVEAIAVLGSDRPLNIKFISQDDLGDMKLSQIVSDEQAWVSGISVNDYYGAHYLLDLILATRYCDAKVIGKGEWFKLEAGELKVLNPESAYREAKSLSARRSIISPEIAEIILASDWFETFDDYKFEQNELFAIDPYNYCENLSQPSQEQLEQIDDIEIDVGLGLKQLMLDAEEIPPHKSQSDGMSMVSGRNLALFFKGEPLQTSTSKNMLELEHAASSQILQLSRNKLLGFEVIGSTLNVSSSLDDGKHEYIYSPKLLTIETFYKLANRKFGESIDFHFLTEPGLNLNLVVLFFDADKKRVGHQLVLPNRNVSIEIPQSASFIKLGLRVYAGGNAKVKGFVLERLDLDPEIIQGQSDVLLLTNHYPSYDDLYRNAFVHSRVRAYAELGQAVDVFRLRMGEAIQWHEFQNVDVTSGSQEALEKLLHSGRYRHVLVHFLSPDMWKVLNNFKDEIKITVWVHGSEIRPWTRRTHDYKAESEELAKAQSESKERMAFWRSILENKPKNLKLVFVSQHFVDEVMEDLGFKLNEEDYEIIHNPIDTSLFKYEKKDPELRKKILSIRPYASNTYANDLSVKAVIELSKEEFFEDLEFRFVGDGVLFDKVLEPLKQFKNVKIEKRFLNQNDIASVHKEYGVFLCPSRLDSQGVSRDEAMASGLVAVTTAVAAIPEFIDHKTGFVVPAEDFRGLAESIKELYFTPQLFVELSHNAAQRVRTQSRKELMTKKELSVFKN